MLLALGRHRRLASDSFMCQAWKGSLIHNATLEMLQLKAWRPPCVFADSKWKMIHVFADFGGAWVALCMVALWSYASDFDSGHDPRWDTTLSRKSFLSLFPSAPTSCAIFRIDK